MEGPNGGDAGAPGGNPGASGSNAENVALRRQVPIELPQPFSGAEAENFNQWCRRFEVAMAASNDTELTKRLPTKLNGPAFTFWEG